MRPLPTNPQLILILGGCRSGKSALALKVSAQLGTRKLFIATAQALDGEMRDRIIKHQAERGPDWTTLEEPMALAGALRTRTANHDLVLVDCLTVWISNLLCSQQTPPPSIPDATLDLMSALKARRQHVVIISNEVGMGIVPENALARRFRDEQGRLNQQIASIADSVLFVAAGLPLALKGKLP